MVRKQGIMRLSRIAALWIVCLLVAGTLAVLASGAGTTTRVSVATGGEQGNSWSGAGARFSANGRYVAFSSAASNLVVGDTNGEQDIFVHDRTTGATTRVSVATGGGQADGQSEAPSINADGRYVAFTSNASNLVAGDTNTDADTFVHDRTTGVTTRVSVSSSGVQAVACVYGSEDITALSADGRYVAFRSDAGNLVAEDANEHGDIFVHDRTTGRTSRVSVATGGAEAFWGGSGPTLSADGRYVAFQGSANELGGGGTNVAGIFIHDRATGHTNLIKTDVGAAVGVYGNQHPTISGDGRYVAFFSWDSTVVADDTNGTGDVFIHNRSNGQTTRVSVATGGAGGNNLSAYPAISADGRYVAFSSYASNLVSGDTSGAGDIFVRDRTTGTTTRVSNATDGTQGTQDAMYPTLSGDGRYVAFESGSANLVAGDTNGAYDIFVHDREAPAPLVTAWAPKGTAVSTAANLTVTFDLSMTRTSVNNALKINGVKAGTFGGKFTWAGNKLTFNPTTNLTAGTSYKISISTDAKSSAGVNLAKAFTWTVKTKPAASSIVTVASAPTASGAQITLHLSAASDVTVSIRNLAGRKIAVLAPGRLAAGVQSLLWNGKSKSGTRVPAGLYLVQVKANSGDGSSAQAMTSLQLR